MRLALSLLGLWLCLAVVCSQPVQQQKQQQQQNANRARRPRPVLVNHYRQRQRQQRAQQKQQQEQQVPNYDYNYDYTQLGQQPGPNDYQAPVSFPPSGQTPNGQGATGQGGPNTGSNNLPFPPIFPPAQGPTFPSPLPPIIAPTPPTQQVGGQESTTPSHLFHHQGLGGPMYDAYYFVCDYYINKKRKRRAAAYDADDYDYGSDYDYDDDKDDQEDAKSDKPDKPNKPEEEEESEFEITRDPVAQCLKDIPAGKTIDVLLDFTRQTLDMIPTDFYHHFGADKGGDYTKFVTDISHYMAEIIWDIKGDLEPEKLQVIVHDGAKKWFVNGHEKLSTLKRIRRQYDDYDYPDDYPDADYAPGGADYGEENLNSLWENTKTFLTEYWNKVKTPEMASLERPSGTEAAFTVVITGAVPRIGDYPEPNLVLDVYGAAAAGTKGYTKQNVIIASPPQLMYNMVATIRYMACQAIGGLQ